MSLTQKTHPYAKRDLLENFGASPQNSQDHQLHPLKKNLSSIYSFIGFPEAETLSAPQLLPFILGHPNHHHLVDLSSIKIVILWEALESHPHPAASGHFRNNRDRQLFSTKIPSYMKGGVVIFEPADTNWHSEEKIKSSSRTFLLFFSRNPISWFGQDTLVYRCFSPGLLVSWMSWEFLTDNQYNIHTHWYLNRSLWPSLNCIKLLQHASCSWNLSIKPILFRSIWCSSWDSLGPKSAESIKSPSINSSTKLTLEPQLKHPPCSVVFSNK